MVKLKITKDKDGVPFENGGYLGYSYYNMVSCKRIYFKFFLFNILKNLS